MSKITTYFSLCFFMFLLAHEGMAQNVKKDTTYWLLGNINSVTFSQISLQNWEAGGASSLSLNAFVHLYGDYKKKRHSWKNTLDLGFGIVKQGSDLLQKSDDKINLVTKYGFKLNKNNKRWHVSALLDFRTQFAYGFASNQNITVISKFFSPAYLTLGGGLEYSPNDHFSMSLIPLTGKFTFVLDRQIVRESDAFGVEKNAYYRSEMGTYFRILYKGDVLKNVHLDSRLELFTNYDNSFGNFDVSFQNNLVMNINKFLTTHLFTQVLYDEDIQSTKETETGKVLQSPKIQIKNIFGIGITIQLGQKRKKQ